MIIPPDIMAKIAKAILVDLGRDLHLERCDLAKRGGADATLACAECGRAKWMHETRHDTCGMFQWVTHRTLTDYQIATITHMTDLPEDLRRACCYADRRLCLGDGFVRDAKQIIASAINIAKKFASISNGAST